MSNIIDTIQVSGVTYTIQGSGGGSPTVELTQAEYDALVSAGTVANDTYYIITDAQSGDLTQYWTSAQTQSAITEATSGKVETSAITSAVTSASTDNEIPTAKAVWEAASGGGGTTYTAGRGIDITNDTISLSLPISAGTGNNSVRENGWNSNTVASGNYSHAEGYGSSANGQGSHAEGYNTKAVGNASHTEGSGTKSSNPCEHASGQYNVSNKANTTFGDSGNTLFSVGNGTAVDARHNAFEIRQNGDIYLSSGGTDIKLQDHLGGGGGITSGEVQTMIDESISGKADTSAVTAVQDSLSGYVTTNTYQDITGKKTFVWGNNNDKPVVFKQLNNSAKIGFQCKNSASTNNELATFELRPETYTDSSSVKHPLLYIGHYRNTSTANNGIVQTMVGFRQYDQSGAAAYHYLMPLPAEAKTPFSLTTSFKNYFAPLGFKNGDTMITTDNTGVADFSNVLGGLKLVKITAADYSLITPDENTVYFVGDSTNGYTMKLGSANVN